MKNTLKIAVAALFLSVTVVVSASAVVVPPKMNDEASLQSIIDTYFGTAGVINVANTDCAGELFKSIDPSAFMIEEIAGFKDKNILSWYDPLHINVTGEIFSGPYGVGSTPNPKPFTPAADPFGFMLTTPQGQKYYSQAGLNADGYDHFWVFLDPIHSVAGRLQFIVGVEDYLGGYDGDHNDMVFSVAGITPVPEPGTLMLLGTGLIGAVGFAKRKLS